MLNEPAESLTGKSIVDSLLAAGIENEISWPAFAEGALSIAGVPCRALTSLAGRTVNWNEYASAAALPARSSIMSAARESW